MALGSTGIARELEPGDEITLGRPYSRSRWRYELRRKQREREITAKFNTEELLRGWEGRAEHAKVLRPLRSSARADGRIRENNEDKFEFFQPDDPRRSP